MDDIKWIKLTVGMFDNRKIKHIRKLPEGNNIVLIWVMLLTMAGRCNSSGFIFLTENIPYTPKMLADELGFDENVIQVALNALETFGMIHRDGELLSIPGWEEHQNATGLEKVRQQTQKRVTEYRERQKQQAKLLGCNVTETLRNATVTQQNKNKIKNKKEELDKEIEIEKDLKDNKKNKSPKPETMDELFKRLISNYSLSQPLIEKIQDWLKYKSERKELYKEQGMKSLITTISKHANHYGDLAVIDLIDECMASGWVGIIWDKLDNKNPKGSAYMNSIKNRVSEVDNW